MSKTKHNAPRKPKQSFIKFSKLQRNYLTEVRTRQQREFNEALETIYEELGIIEKMMNAPPNTYKLKMDFTGLEVLIKQGPKPPNLPDTSPGAIISKGKDRKDN